MLSGLLGGLKGSVKVSKAEAGEQHQPVKDALDEENMRDYGEHYLSVSGIPATADSCAYEPIQKLLAVRGVHAPASHDGSLQTLCAPTLHARTGPCNMHAWRAGRHL